MNMPNGAKPDLALACVMLLVVAGVWVQCALIGGQPRMLSRPSTLFQLLPLILIVATSASRSPVRCLLRAALCRLPRPKSVRSPLSRLRTQPTDQTDLQCSLPEKTPARHCDS